MKNLTLAFAAAGAIALVATATPAQAGFFTGLRAPQVDAGPTEVQRRCWHRRHWSGWRCAGPRHWHRRWESRQHRRHRLYYAPGFYRW